MSTCLELQAFAKEIAQNEKHHVEALRSVLGSQAVPCPLVNLTAFADAFNGAIAPSTFSPPFSPFVNDLSFFLATFLFEDVGVSAYQGTCLDYVGSAHGWSSFLVLCSLSATAVTVD